MVAVAIKIAVEKLANPEADIRYQLAIHLDALTDGLLKDDGYDYTEDGELVVFLGGDDEKSVDKVLSFLQTESFLGNTFAEAATVAVDLGPGWNVVFPDDYQGNWNPKD